MIIQSLLDTDLYKFTMMQVVLHHFPGANVAYRFKCRSKGVDLRPFAAEIVEEIEHYCQLRMSEDELEYLRSLPYIKADFVEFLRLFQSNSKFVEVKTTDEFELIIRGPWLHTILFEVPILSIISEVYFRNTDHNNDLAVGRKRLDANIQYVKDHAIPGEFKFSDFGTRRRYSRAWQFEVVDRCRQELKEYFTGTSNVGLAKQFQTRAMGTMAHEYVQACQSLGPRLLYSQQFAFEVWAQEYRGDLGIALSDTLSTDAFLRDFDLYFCKLFDGARHDSGDPFEWGDKLLAHYLAKKLDPKTKTMVFSNGLTFPKAIEINDYFKNKTQPAFGIGTWLTNDVGPKSLDIVIKMIECNGQPVAKISEDPGKSMCRDESYMSYLRKVFQIPKPPF